MKKYTPRNIIYIRHGQSEANKASKLEKTGDTTLVTDAFMKLRDFEYRLTPLGAEQAKATGEWIKKHVIGSRSVPEINRYFTSSYVRAMETSAHLELDLGKQDVWLPRHYLRERDFGEMRGLTLEQRKAQFANNMRYRDFDPLYSAGSGGGESVAHVAYNRLGEFMDTLCREIPDGTAIAVCHGEVLAAARLLHERMLEREWIDYYRDNENWQVNNCQIYWYSSVNPEDPTDIQPRLTWFRSVWPYGGQDTGWIKIEFPRMKNQQLLEYAESFPRVHDY